LNGAEKDNNKHEEEEEDHEYSISDIVDLNRKLIENKIFIFIKYDRSDKSLQRQMNKVGDDTRYV